MGKRREFHLPGYRTKIISYIICSHYTQIALTDNLSNPRVTDFGMEVEIHTKYAITLQRMRIIPL